MDEASISDSSSDFRCTKYENDHAHDLASDNISDALDEEDKNEEFGQTNGFHDRQHTLAEDPMTKIFCEEKDFRTQIGHCEEVNLSSKAHKGNLDEAEIQVEVEVNLKNEAKQIADQNIQEIERTLEFEDMDVTNEIVATVDQTKVEKSSGFSSFWKWFKPNQKDEHTNENFQ